MYHYIEPTQIFSLSFLSLNAIFSNFISSLIKIRRWSDLRQRPLSPHLHRWLRLWNLFREYSRKIDPRKRSQKLIYRKVEENLCHVTISYIVSFSTERRWDTMFGIGIQRTQTALFTYEQVSSHTIHILSTTFFLSIIFYILEQGNGEPTTWLHLLTSDSRLALPYSAFISFWWTLNS